MYRLIDTSGRGRAVGGGFPVNGRLINNHPLRPQWHVGPNTAPSDFAGLPHITAFMSATGLAVRVEFVIHCS
jgi:hypothetical protein